MHTSGRLLKKWCKKKTVRCLAFNSVNLKSRVTHQSDSHIRFSYRWPLGMKSWKSLHHKHIFHVHKHHPLLNCVGIVHSPNNHRWSQHSVDKPKRYTTMTVSKAGISERLCFECGIVLNEFQTLNSRTHRFIEFCNIARLAHAFMVTNRVRNAFDVRATSLSKI